jgi:cyd operon protein YbgT
VDGGLRRHDDLILFLKGLNKMWYFTWLLGLGFAAAFAAMNAMWLELNPGAFERHLNED